MLKHNSKTQTHLIRDGSYVPNEHNNEAPKQRGSEAETLKVRHKYRDDGGLDEKLRQTSKHENTGDEKENKEKGHQGTLVRIISHGG